MKFHKALALFYTLITAFIIKLSRFFDKLKVKNVVFSFMKL